MSSYLIWGAGGHGKVVADLVRALGHRVFGFADSDVSRMGQRAEPGGARVEITDAALRVALRQAPQPDLPFDAVALGIGDNDARHECLRSLRACCVVPLVHPTAVVSDSARIGRGTVVFAGSVVNAAAKVGDACIINTGAVVEHDCDLGDAVHVSPGAVLCGHVRVGHRSWIGASAVVIQEITIGADVIVGAGAVVTRDVPDGATVVGNPARIIRQRG